MGLTYDRIQEQLAAALPELMPAAERYWRLEGRPGEDCGNYIFFENMFASYVEVFASADDEVGNLAYGGLYEGRARWWFARGGPYIGPLAAACLDRYERNWRPYVGTDMHPTEQEKARMYEQYGVRLVIASEMAAEGVPLEAIPGVTPVDEEGSP